MMASRLAVTAAELILAGLAVLLPQTNPAAAHAAQLFERVKGGKKDASWDGSGMSSARLAILPGVTHYNIFSSPELASTVTSLLDASKETNR
jgi:hypothetical protein